MIGVKINFIPSYESKGQKLLRLLQENNISPVEASCLLEESMTQPKRYELTEKWRKAGEQG